MTQTEKRSITLAFIHPAGSERALWAALSAAEYTLVTAVAGGRIFAHESPKHPELIALGEVQAHGFRFTAMVFGMPSELHLTPNSFVEAWKYLVATEAILSKSAGLPPGRFERSVGDEDRKRDLFGAIPFYVPAAKYIRGGA